MPNPYIDMLPKPPAEDHREAVQALRQFAEALQQYTGKDTDVEVPITVHPEGGPDRVARVQISVYVPKTDYANLVLVARCRGEKGFPVAIDPYFAGDTFPQGLPQCDAREDLDDALRQFVQSPEVVSLLEYMQRHAQPRRDRE
jgi:hypothetical protein